MESDEFKTAQRVLNETDDQLADTLGVTPAIVRGWANGTVSIPRRDAKYIAFLVAAKQRAVALESSGLPDCPWMRAHENPPPTDDVKKIDAHMNAVLAHLERCPTCLAREKWATEKFGPMPRPPAGGFLRVFEWVERVPAIARPAVLGALLLAGLVLFRIVFSLPRWISDARQLAAAGIAMAAAAAAGAVGGFAYSLTRPSFQRLGRPGDYLSGIVSVFAYMVSLILAAPVAFGEPIVEGRAGWVIMAIVSIVFGLVIGHSWFRSESAPSA